MADTRSYYLFDWLGYYQQPDLRPLGYSPVSPANNGVYNRALGRDNEVLVPGFSETSALRSRAAAMKIAESVNGGDPIPQMFWDRPLAYQRVPQDLVYDLEGAGFDPNADIQAPSRDRARVVDALVDHLSLIRDTWKVDGKPVRNIWTYLPQGPVNGKGGGMNPSDPLYPGLMWLSLQDWQPWLAGISGFMPECSMMTDKVTRAVERVKQVISALNTYAPGLPIVAEMQLCYAHEMPDDNPKKYWLVEYPVFMEYVDKVLDLPQISGVSLFGNSVRVHNPVGIGNPADGNYQLDYRFIRRHVEGVAKLVKSKTRKP